MLTLVLSGAVFAQAKREALDETWFVRIGGHPARINSDGSFTIRQLQKSSRVNAFTQQSLGSAPAHFVRLVGFQPEGPTLRYVYSEPIQLQPGTTINIRNDQLTFSDTLPFVVTALTLEAPSTRLTEPGQTTPLTVTVTLPNGSRETLAPNNPATIYRSSNNNIASISNDGIITVHSRGRFLASVVHEGITGSLAFEVVSPPTSKTIIGFVYGPEDEPLERATIHVPGTRLTALSDPNGRYSIEGVPPTLSPVQVRLVSHSNQPTFGITDPLNTEHDTIDGGILIGSTLDQLLAVPCTDADQDCLPDEIEVALGLDPRNADTDGDGLPDGKEDHDGDQLPNQIEVLIGTDPQIVDSDRDGLRDGSEVLKHFSSPILADADGNGQADGIQDQDGDGLLDVLEDLNGNFRLDPGESDPMRLDTDHDGVTDPFELAERTAPDDPFEFEPRRLASFSFDANPFLGNENQRPLDQDGAILADSFRPTGRSGFHARGGSRLVYRVVEQSNKRNLSLLRGSIKFWFQPQWNSGERGNPFGSRLIEVGRFSPNGVENDGWWGLFLNQDRTVLTFGSQRANGFDWERYLEAKNLNFRAGEWYEIELSYGPRVTYPYGREDPDRVQIHSNSFLYINGVQRGVGVGVDSELLPNDQALKAGFAIGSELAGTLSTDAVFDELLTYNYPLHQWNVRILTDRNWAAVADAEAETITLQRRFPRSPRRPIPVDIYRRPVGGDDWGEPIVREYLFPLYVDRDVTVGQPYEYRFFDTQSISPADQTPQLLQQHVTAAIDLPPTFNRGRAIMMIENSIFGPLAKEIEQFKLDLAGDGWEVVSHGINRQNDERLELNRNAMLISKGLIDLETDLNQTNVVILLGHVPVPMSGYEASDGHTDQPGKRPDHRGAWTADGFYGTTNKTFWTDISPVTIDNLDSPQNSNTPGDGKFDQDFLPQPFGFAVGRIDFARMNVFTNASFLPGYPNNSVRETEIELLRLYLNKNHRYRHGDLQFKPRMASFRGFGSNFDESSGYYNAHNVAASLFGLEDSSNLNVRGLSQRVSFAMGFHEMNSFNTGMALGWEHDDITNTYSYRSEDLIHPENEPNIAFHLNFGSYFGDFNLRANNWIKSLLGLPHSGLAALYYFPNKWRLEKMGLGAPLAVAMQEFNDPSKYAESLTLEDGSIFTFHAPFHAPPRMLSILGDPTLRIHILPSPRSPQATASGRTVRLTWQAPPVSGVQYYIFRSSNGLEGPFGHLTAIAPTTSTQFIDSFAPFGPKLYGIRAAKMHDGPSGSYLNLSQATFVEVE